MKPSIESSVHQPATAPFALLPLTSSQLTVLAQAGVPAEFAKRAEPGALPPDFVAARALNLEAAASHTAAPTSFLMVRCLDGRIVGACGFKTALGGPRVEVGYGVAENAQRQGAATHALGLLVQLAAQEGSNEVLAEVLPSNAASLRVVQKAGFRLVGSRFDEDGEFVEQWVCAASV